MTPNPYKILRSPPALGTQEIPGRKLTPMAIVARVLEDRRDEKSGDDCLDIQ
jgi:hypothetical protein